MHTLLQKKIRTLTLRGFSLAEVLLASFVLSAGLLAITALISGSLRSSLEIQDSIVAVGLSQEGIELVRNVRDNAWVSSAYGFTKFSNSQKHCRINYDHDATNALDCFPGNGNGPFLKPLRYTLQYSNSNQVYFHNDTASERFSRYVYIDYTSPGTTLQQEIASVISFVYWGTTPPANIDNGDSLACTIINKCVFTKVVLTNWR